MNSPAQAGLVDAHQHVWDLAEHEQPWLQLPGNEPLLRNYTEADLIAVAAPAGVTATVVVQTVIEPGETPELLELAARSDLIAAVVGWVDLQAADVAETLAALQERRDGGYLSGIRHPVLVEEDPDWLRRPAVHRGLAAVGAAGLAYDFVVPQDVLPAAVYAAAACPDVAFVLDHLGNPEIATDRPDERWAIAINQMAELPNTFCKLSGILAEAPVAQLVPYYQTALEAFGPERLMFGSDWPPCTLSASYQEVVTAAQSLTADLSPAERDAIFTGTANRVYRLPEPS